MERIDERPSDLVSNVEMGFHQITQDGIAKTTNDILQLAKEQMELIAQPVDFHYDPDFTVNARAKRSRVTAPSDVDIPCNFSVEYPIEEPVMTECSDLCGLQEEYSYLTETVSNSGDESFTQGGSESWLHQHAMKLEDMYYEELEKISENVESTFEMNEDEDWKEPENLEDILFTDEKENHATKTQDRPLYDGCPITVGVSMLLIMTVAMHHGMTGEALQDILTLVSLHCISPNYCTESLRKFKQYFAIANLHWFSTTTVLTVFCTSKTNESKRVPTLFARSPSKASEISHSSLKYQL